MCGWRNRLPERKKELGSVPFPRARVKLGGRVSSDWVTQPLTYIFEPLTVSHIKRLLQTLFMYAQGQHPQPLVTRRSHHVHFLMFDKDKYIDSATFVIWSCLRFDLFWPLTLIRRSDKEVIMDFFDVWPRLTHWQCNFYHFTLFAIWPFLTLLLITFVAIHPLVILTKFGQNPIRHVGEETNCEKEERGGRGGKHKKEIS